MEHFRKFLSEQPETVVNNVKTMGKNHCHEFYHKNRGQKEFNPRHQPHPNQNRKKSFVRKVMLRAALEVDMKQRESLSIKNERQ